jgi:ketosteroid isomerase-like protein
LRFASGRQTIFRGARRNLFGIEVRKPSGDSKSEKTIASLQFKPKSLQTNLNRVIGARAIASGFISAQGKKTDGAPFTAKVRFLAVLVKQNGQWQLAATQSSAVKVPQHSPN